MIRARRAYRVTCTWACSGQTLQPAFDEAPRCVPFGARGGTLCGVETILSVLQVAIAVITIFLILMHSGKDSGLSGAFGVGSGTGPLGGGSLVERNLNRWTIFFSVLFFLNAGVLLTRPWA
jgi:preprotein translocase subunit SecG